MEELNEPQRRAATCGDGPHLILAGPGTGKTTTLAARFGHLVRSGVDPRRIMAVTFTKKAGLQLQARFKQQLRTTPKSLTIGTFHSLAGRFLRKHASLAGLTPAYKILDEAAQRKLFQELKFRHPDGTDELAEIFSRAKDRMLTAADYAAEVALLAETKDAEAPDDPSLEEKIAQQFAEYEEALLSRNLCDFSDLIAHAVRILEGHEKARNAVAGRFDHLLVDEYQDINLAQARLIAALLHPHHNLWVVGDDDQAIYGFRGSVPEYVLEFTEDHPGATVHRLEQNYRSTPPIVTFANQLIRHNERRYAKPLIPNRPHGPRVVLMGHADEDAEAEWLGDSIQRVLDSGIPASEIAVLCRVSALSLAIQLVLTSRGIPVVLLGARDFWSRVEVRYFIGMMLVAGEVPDAPIHRFFGKSYTGRSLEREAADLWGESFESLVDHISATIVAATPSRLRAERKLEWQRNITLVAAEARRAGSLDALMELSEAQSRPLRKKDGESVILSTIHSAKGLEWNTVFVAGFERGLLPHDYCEDLEEERRVAYVAVTRSKRVLALSFCEQRDGERAGPSLFLAEVLPELAEEVYDWRRTDLPLPGTKEAEEAEKSARERSKTKENAVAVRPGAEEDMERPATQEDAVNERPVAAEDMEWPAIQEHAIDERPVAAEDMEWPAPQRTGSQEDTAEHPRSKGLFDRLARWWRRSND